MLMRMFDTSDYDRSLRRRRLLSFGLLAGEAGGFKFLDVAEAIKGNAGHDGLLYGFNYARSGGLSKRA